MIHVEYETNQLGTTYKEEEELIQSRSRWRWRFHQLFGMTIPALNDRLSLNWCIEIVYMRVRAIQILKALMKVNFMKKQKFLWNRAVSIKGEKLKLRIWLDSFSFFPFPPSRNWNQELNYLWTTKQTIFKRPKCFFKSKYTLCLKRTTLRSQSYTSFLQEQESICFYYWKKTHFVVFMGAQRQMHPRNPSPVVVVVVKCPWFK